MLSDRFILNSLGNPVGGDSTKEGDPLLEARLREMMERLTLNGLLGPVEDDPNDPLVKGLLGHLTRQTEGNKKFATVPELQRSSDFKECAQQLRKEKASEPTDSPKQSISLNKV